jgi:carbamoyltransferase
VDHHIAHAAGGYFTSGWDEALLVTCDGVGALKSSLVAVGRAGKVRVLARTFFPNSLGQFWEMITVLCGFNPARHGGKITGLAAFGDSNAPCYEEMRRAVWCEGLEVRSRLDPLSLRRALNNTPREHIAATAQRRLEEVMTALVRRAVQETGLRRLVLSGGVFANVKLNQRICEIDGVEDVFVFPPMADEGLSLGAALYAAGQSYQAKPRRLSTLYLGPSFNDSEIRRSLEGAGLKPVEFSDEDALVESAVNLLVAQKVVAVFRGAMEFGPRALGNRSILYRANDKSVNAWLNQRLGRTEFMPFAPVTLAEHAVPRYARLPKDHYPAHFMTITYDSTDTQQAESPAVVHVDGTARPQLLERRENPFYYDILARFHKKTGVPTLVNTSFNMHEEPIVCTPEDAIRAYLEGRLDALVIGKYLVQATESQSPQRTPVL